MGDNMHVFLQGLGFGPAQFWRGRDISYANQLTPELRANAQATLQKVGALLWMIAGLVSLEQSPKTGSIITSGWRPAQVNANIPGAAVRSRHITGQAVDLYDPEGALDDWCMEHQFRLSELELWLEHPSATKGWCHLQTVPPRSGKRVFYP